MSLDSVQIKRINEQQLKGCTFASGAAYSTECTVRESRRKLHLAMLLADNIHSNIKVVFNTNEGPREILTSIWGATDRLIILKSGNRIPVEALVEASLETI
jgi:hypothetical protein